MSGAVAYSDMKQELVELLGMTFDPHRQTFHRIIQDPSGIGQILKNGARRARDMARPLLSRVRRCVGIEKL